MAFPLCANPLHIATRRGDCAQRAGDQGVPERRAQKFMRRTTMLARHLASDGGSALSRSRAHDLLCRPFAFEAALVAVRRVLGAQSSFDARAVRGIMPRRSRERKVTVNNVIQFPQHAMDSPGPASVPEPPSPDMHGVQFYEEETHLYKVVADYLAAGLETGDRLVAVVTPSHREGIVRSLGRHRADEAMSTGQLTVLDARETLARFMVGSAPDPDLFRAMLDRVLASVRQDSQPRSRIRIYGEMVDLLWREGNATAAIRLEELWNDALRAHSFSLLCAYVMGNFYKHDDAEQFMQVCRNHSHVVPTEEFAELDDSRARLREISLLQQRAKSLESEIKHRKELEIGLRDALRERSRVEEELRVCIDREREARARAEESDAFKEIFLGILGHDLRNPLNTVLTTARLMTMRGEVSAESQKRLDRIVSSGVRMQRMIEQLLDVTRARLADGIPVVRSDQEIELLPLVSRIVDEIRTAAPSCSIEVRAAAPCKLRVDADRFEQVVSNLVGNAVAHGSPQTPIVVTLSAAADDVVLRVHNHGKPIDPRFLPRLFDPFKKGAKPEGRSEGLGLGLYISERIVRTHGGTIGVTSSQAAGTCFEATFPRGRSSR